MSGRVTLLAVFLCAAMLLGAGARTSSKAGGAGVAPQTCGLENTEFWCPVDRMCKPRSQRCTGSDICVDPQTMVEAECHATSTPGQYSVQLGHANLGVSGSKTILEHQFVTFRGLTYEFGASYAVQILDVLDPQYKYIGGRDLNSGGIETVGASFCTWQDATLFASRWNTHYNLLTNNCQRFAQALINTLLDSPCNLQFRPRLKQVETVDNYITNLLSNCSVVCCFGGAGSAYPNAATSVWVVTAGVFAYSLINLGVWF